MQDLHPQEQGRQGPPGLVEGLRALDAAKERAERDEQSRGEHDLHEDRGPPATRVRERVPDGREDERADRARGVDGALGDDREHRDLDHDGDDDADEPRVLGHPLGPSHALGDGDPHAGAPAGARERTSARSAFSATR